MIGKLVQATVLVTAGLAISGSSGCTPKTVATKPPPAPDYMAPSPPSPPAAATRATCYNEADLSMTMCTRVEPPRGRPLCPANAAGARRSGGSPETRQHVLTSRHRLLTRAEPTYCRQADNTH